MAARKGELVKSVLVILAGLTVLGIAIYLVKGGAEQFEPKVRYTIRFANGGGLSGGDDVYLDGQKVGDVVDTVRIEEARRVDVIVEVAKRVRIPVGSIAIVTRSVTGTVAIEIMSGKSNDTVAAGAALQGMLPRSFSELQEQISEVGGEFNHVWRKATDVVEDAKGVAGDLDLEEIRAHWDEATGAMGRVSDTWHLLLDEAEGPFGEVRDGFERGTADWRRLGNDIRDDGSAMRDKLETVRANYEQAAGDVRAVWPDLDGLRAGYTDAMDRFEGAADKLRAVVHEVQETVIESKPEVKRIADDAGEAFARFQTLQGDLLRAPWKLLNKPSPDEVIAVHRFNALRLYLEAANEVSRTVDGLDVLRRLGALHDPQEARFVDDVFARLRRALDGFDARQKRVVQLLIEVRGAAAK